VNLDVAGFMKHTSTPPPPASDQALCSVHFGPFLSGKQFLANSAHVPSAIRVNIMRDETLSIHAGYETDRRQNPSRVPIYQTVLTNSRVGPWRGAVSTSRLRQHLLSPEQPDHLGSGAARRGPGRRFAALCVGSGMAAIHYAIANITEMGTNIVTTPQIYGATYTLFNSVFRKQGIVAALPRATAPKTSRS